MSDVAVASAPSSAPAPAEVAVPTEHTNLPSPVGQQAPDKPVGADFKGSEHRPPSRREAINAAFERAAKAEPAKARMGHNNPPEPMEKERSKPKEPDREKPELNLRKKPDEQPKSESRERGEHGHFARRDGAQPQAQAQQRANPLPEGTPYREAPQRFSDHARAEWHKTPEPVRGEIHRMHHEFGRAYQQYRGDHAYMNTIRPFAQMAQQHGTSLQRALTNYVGMEEKLRNDVVGGLDVIINNLNLRTPQGQKLTLADVAWHIVNQTPEQRQLLQSQNTQMAQTHQLHQAQQRIRALENQHAQMHYAARFNQTRVGVDQFALTHPRLDELGDLIEQEIKLGFPLDVAYARAERLRPPGTHAPQTRSTAPAAQTRNPPAQTRTSDRSIHGAPGANGSTRPKPQVSRREALANAMRRANI